MTASLVTIALLHWAVMGVFGARLLAETFQEWHRRTA